MSILAEQELTMFQLKADEQDSWGETPIDIATKHGFNSVAEILRCRIIAQTMPTV